MLLYNGLMKYRLLLFDLDETLYPIGSKLWDEISLRMGQYMVDHLNIPVDQVHSVRKNYFDTYGTTLRGLQIHHEIDAHDFLRYVHDIPLEHFLHPDPELKPLLNSLPQRKWICTNADAGHARRVLRFLGVENCFEGITDIIETGFIPKPSPDFYSRALEMAGENEFETCVLFDDLPRNLAPARSLGMTTVLVRPGITSDPSADFTIASIHSLPQSFPELWKNGYPSFRDR
jgi:putative hydrolase of the HAD superfamily